MSGPHEVPPELSDLLAVSEGSRRDDAWEKFVEHHSRLLLHVSRSFGGDHDAVMDRYAFILEKLRSDDFHRLRTWARDRRSKLTTWLVVVAQRLSLDENRRRYGRPSDGHGAATSREERRRLADLLAEELDPNRRYPAAGDNPSEDPESTLRRVQLAQALTRSVAELPTSDQLLLTFRFRDGLSAADIARSLHFPSPFHVYRQLDRLLTRLRRALQARGVNDATP